MVERTTPGIPDLAPNRTDRLMSLANAVSGGLAELGPAFAELIGATLPNRRIDRIVQVLELLEARVTDVEADVIRDRISRSEEAQDLFEEGMRQATRAVSSERREQVAEMLRSTLTSDDLEYIQKKRLWTIFESLTDQELVILQYHGISDAREGEDFWERHQDAITGPAPHMGSSSPEIDQGAVHESLRAHLRELGLLRPRYKRPKRGELPEFDEKTGMMKASGNEITRLGGVLLRHLGLPSKL